MSGVVSLNWMVVVVAWVKREIVAERDAAHLVMLLRGGLIRRVQYHNEGRKHTESTLIVPKLSAINIAHTVEVNGVMCSLPFHRYGCREPLCVSRGGLSSKMYGR
jgi:hypothetical protein